MPPRFAPFNGEMIDLWLPINPENVRYSARNGSLADAGGATETRRHPPAGST